MAFMLTRNETDVQGLCDHTNPALLSHPNLGAGTSALTKQIWNFSPNETVAYVPDLVLPGKRKQVKVTDPVATTAATPSQIWKRHQTEESAAR